MLLCKGQKLFALLFAAMDLDFSRQRYSGTGLFEFVISALIIIILPRLEHLPQWRIVGDLVPEAHEIGLVQSDDNLHAPVCIALRGLRQPTSCVKVG